MKIIFNFSFTFRFPFSCHGFLPPFVQSLLYCDCGRSIVRIQPISNCEKKSRMMCKRLKSIGYLFHLPRTEQSVRKSFGLWGDHKNNHRTVTTVSDEASKPKKRNMWPPATLLVFTTTTLFLWLWLIHRSLTGVTVQDFFLENLQRLNKYWATTLPLMEHQSPRFFFGGCVWRLKSIHLLFCLPLTEYLKCKNFFWRMFDNWEVWTIVS